MAFPSRTRAAVVGRDHAPATCSGARLPRSRCLRRFVFMAPTHRTCGSLNIARPLVLVVANNGCRWRFIAGPGSIHCGLNQSARSPTTRQPTVRVSGEGCIDSDDPSAGCTACATVTNRWPISSAFTHQPPFFMPCPCSPASVCGGRVG